ncbi:hypothetical protein C499_01645 [Halogeometricum borinquense DSM 11551]|uniref:Uncharacterized protein n=1 Tax=Halogeometricum borinquense (strain ATCC 700274 / DSM 11551 / JCM 10706 / KCTC 4070 / PR3) TaxID=469382 RepID=E4NNY8_HALBP|nr:hypothetical protein [Halogeometricum borinquense]ADQ66419.1 hypothetical protein Hbor_08220 [Halogeometricum borinquense DSM 11551]ELY31139.1 hypothetical protein C499_01645 [Halogeometricum borinquense DSM 11551]
MPSNIAIIHYCEGAGHATRMLAIARALESAGCEIQIAGGGAGARFVDLNGYDAFEPTTVDYIGDYQDGTVTDLLAGSIPDTTRRISEIVEWLRKTDPDAVVTDDMFAVMAAVRVGIPQYVVKHDMPSIYEDRTERLGAQFHCSLQLSVSREFFYPAVWEPKPDDPDQAVHVPPIALDGSDDGVPADIDVVVVPSHYSNLESVGERLTDRGLSVVNVGSEGWEAVPSLLPYLRAADAVVCSGYSTVMDAAVAGTHCVVYPATDEQSGVASRLRDLRGFSVVGDEDAAVAAAQASMESPSYKNGATVVADRVLSDLRSREQSKSDQTGKPTRRGMLRAAAATVGTTVIGTAAVSAATPKAYAIRGSRRADRSFDQESAVSMLTENSQQVENQLPTVTSDDETSRFDGATVMVEALADQWERVSGPGVIRAMQMTVTLPDDDEADYRHWLWMGADTTDTQTRTGLLGGKSALVPRHIRLTFGPAVGTVERVGVMESDESSGLYGSFGPDETPPKHPSGAPPDGTASIIWQGKDDKRNVSLLGYCDTSIPESADADDWEGAAWQFAFDADPVDN